LTIDSYRIAIEHVYQMQYTYFIYMANVKLKLLKFDF